MGHHEDTAMEDPFFKCGTCHAEFAAGLQARDNHCLATGHYPPFYECDRCSEVFLDGEAKWSHMLEHNHFAYECERCGETYPDEEEYTDHCNSQLCSRLECALCRVAFTSPERLQQHERINHLWCSACKQGFQDGAAVQDHIADKHEVQGSRQLQNGGTTQLSKQGTCCPFCNRPFKTAGCVAQHLESNTCPSAPPLTRDELFYLIQSKDPNRRLTGDLTGWNGISAPTWSFDSNGYQCYLCGKKFDWNHSVCQHINSETRKSWHLNQCQQILMTF
ncbi:hypothetical protein DL546_005056 [Coniochaeta pulveracea]|uniref:C2H2-type domain-containing protein n=1 Tax=Coniochaeta pulveracea TaxID=177199 RepID=A0A420Y5M7_9PEZI|nr:hypothetical protein DL546_005056 [Coniochaeta pulveracea]